MKIGFNVRLEDRPYHGFFPEVTVSEPAYVQTAEIPGACIRLLTETDPETGISRRRLEVENRSDHTMTVQHAHICYLLPMPHVHLDYFSSDWGSEYSPVSVDVTYPVRIGTWSGRSAKGCSPYFQVRSTGRDMQILGLSVGWSGNWEATVSRCGEENLVTAGLLKDGFSHTLRPRACFENIELFDGLKENDDEEGLAHAFRSYYKTNISLLPQDMETLPVCFNSWWPYEDKWIGEDVFFENAVIAKKLGMNGTLLDAGWFGPAGDPTQPGASGWFDKQGDWDLINTRLFPNGIAALGKRVNEEAGIPFGIWCEIEAVGKDSHLFTSNPNLIAKREGKFLNYVCMGNPETRAWALDIFRRLIEEYGAKWIKIDFNLDPVSCDCTGHGHGPGDGLYAHYKGLYAFMDEVRRRYPHVTLENCSSGGLRIDYGIMQHCHLAFLSDPDYTPHHLQCFWGILSHIHPSSCYHFTKSETVCSHNFAWDENGEKFVEYRPVTESTTLARFDYMTRACMMGPMAFSQKLPELPEWALLRIKEHVAFFREISGDYLLRGDMYRLTRQPRSQLRDGDSWSAFQFCNPDGDALLFVFKKQGGRDDVQLRLRGLAESALYEIYPYESSQETQKVTGFELIYGGIEILSPEPEWSEIYRIRKVKPS